jgi:hypothetical protein
MIVLVDDQSQLGDSVYDRDGRVGINHGWAYVLTRDDHPDSPWGNHETVKIEQINLSKTDLPEAKKGLQDWAVDVVRTIQPPSAAYRASLIELDDDGDFDLYFSEEDADVFWFHGVPHVALTS